MGTDIITARQNLIELQGNINCPKFSDLAEYDQESLAVDLVNRLGFGTNHIPLNFDGKYPYVDDLLIKICQDTNYPRSLLLSGVVGPGKTGYLSAMIKERFRYWASHTDCKSYVLSAMYASMVFYLTHKEIVDIILSGYKDDNIQNEYIATFKEIKECKILMVDDLMANVNETSSNLGHLGELIDYRWSNDLTTWITSNISAEDIAKRPGWERIYSRFADHRWMIYCWIDEKDRRKE